MKKPQLPLLISKPIKIIHLIGSLGSGGAEKMLANIVINSDKNKTEHTIVTFTDIGFLGKAVKAAGISVVTLNLSSHIEWFYKLFVLGKVLLKLKPDILQTWTEYANLIGIIIGKVLRIKIILWSVRCSRVMPYYSLPAKIILKLTTYFSKLPNAILVNSYAGQREHKKIGYDAKTWIYLPNGIDVRRFGIVARKDKQHLREKLGINESDFVIGTVARYEPIKNYRGLLLSASKFLKLYPMVKFLLIGKNVDNNNLELVTLLQQFNIYNSVIMLGEQRNIQDIMPILDVFSLFSYSEGFPNVIAEAMSSGIICVATDVGDNKIIIGDAGFVIPDNDIDALADTWKRIFKMDIYERSVLGKAASARILNNYCLDDIVNKYENFYQTLFYQKKLLYLV